MCIRVYSCDSWKSSGNASDTVPLSSSEGV